MSTSAANAATSSLHAHAKGTASPVSLGELKAHCSACSMRELCLPMGLETEDLRQIDALVGHRIRLRKGAALYHAGDRFTALYAIRIGSLKTAVPTGEGREQVSGYHMLGDIIGLDGIGTERHGCQATALEDSDVCAMPFDRIEEVARAVPPLQRNLHRLLSKEISRDQGVMLLLGTMRAGQRLAAFLISLAERYKQRGYSSTEYVLRMTREEIGSYLGLKLETVSRLFSRFQNEGLIRVQGREVKLLDPVALRQRVGQRA